MVALIFNSPFYILRSQLLFPHMAALRPCINPKFLDCILFSPFDTNVLGEARPSHLFLRTAKAKHGEVAKNWSFGCIFECRMKYYYYPRYDEVARGSGIWETTVVGLNARPFSF